MTTWRPHYDGITERYTRPWGPYTLTVSRALYRWWWTITDELGMQDQSEPQFEDPEAAMWAAEQVAVVLTMAKKVEGRR